MNFINQTNKMGIMQGPANGKQFLFFLFFFKLYQELYKFMYISSGII